MACGRPLLLMVIAITTAPMAFSQLDQGGYISPGDSVVKSMRDNRIIYLPQGGFSFYEVPNGAFKGKILPGPPLNIDGNETEFDSLITSTITGTSIRPQVIPIANYFQTTHERYYLAYEKRIDDFVLVLGDSFQGWISIEEITKKGFELTSWMDFYGKSKGLMIHPVEKLATIRMLPASTAKAIATANELYSEISLTGKCKGSFCLVQVTQYKNPYDPAQSKEKNILKKYKGWIQVVDEDGQPLVAHNTQDQ